MSSYEFELTDEEKRSPLWTKLYAYLQRELDNSRKANDAILPNDETNQLRGRIRALKGLLNLGGSTPPPVL